MSVWLYEEPELKNPTMICGWAGLGNVGLVAVSTLQRLVGAKEFGEIEPYKYFEPSEAVIRNGLIKQMWFPATKFYIASRGKAARPATYGIGVSSDVLLLVGEQQQADEQNAYDMASAVLDDPQTAYREIDRVLAGHERPAVAAIEINASAPQIVHIGFLCILLAPSIAAASKSPGSMPTRPAMKKLNQCSPSMNPCSLQTTTKVLSARPDFSRASRMRPACASTKLVPAGSANGSGCHCRPA